MQIHRQNQTPHTIYQLRDDNIDQTLGEAILSESTNEIRLHGIFVKPEHRRQGHATTLMEAIIGLDNSKTITLCTGLGNIGFFRRFGFEVIEIGDTLVSMERKP